MKKVLTAVFVCVLAFAMASAAMAYENEFVNETGYELSKVSIKDGASIATNISNGESFILEIEVNHVDIVGVTSGGKRISWNYIDLTNETKISLEDGGVVAYE